MTRTRNSPSMTPADDPALDRERLLARAAGHVVVVVEAPSGYGKTAFARSWIRTAPPDTRTLWVSLDSDARDPTVFLERLAVAIAGDDVWHGGTGFDDQASHAGWFARITQQLADAPGPIRLVLDDVHHLASSASRTYLQRLLQGASARLNLLIALQPVELDVGLGTLATEQSVCWLNAAAMALTPPEIEQHARALGHALSPEPLDALLQATQGWPALVRLALAVPLEHQFRVPDALAGLGPVREYLYERFLAHLGPDERARLWQLCCVGSAPLRLLDTLADAPLDRRADLHRLLALGIVQPEEPATELTLRPHPLVREAVLRRLQGPYAPRETLLLAAGRWYWAEGRGSAAIHALLDAGREHLDLAREWLLSLADPLIFHLGHHQVLLDLVARWEQLAGTRDTALSHHAAWALTFQRHFARAEERLAALSPPDATPDASEATLMRGCIAALRDDYATGGRLAHAWLRQAEVQSAFKNGAAWTVYAFHLRGTGDLSGAHQALRRAHTSFGGARSGYGTVWACIVGALTEIRAGRHRDALAEAERGLALCGDTPGFSGQRAMLRAVEAFIRYERNELPALRAALDEAMPLLPDQGIVDTVSLGFTAAARLRAAEGSLGPALDLLSEGERSGVERDFCKLSISLCAERALILARSGAIEQARQLVARITAQELADPITANLIRDRSSRLQTRLSLADGEPAQALAQLAPRIAHARDAGQQYKLCELLLLAAQAEDALDDEPAAFRHLREALAIAGVECYLRLFIDEGAELHALLRRWLKAHGGHAALRTENTWAETLLAALQPAATAGTPQGDAPFEALNRRERQILGLLDQGLSNAQIAARCFLVEGTVKWHLHNLYSKFGVRSRTAALRAAREHGLIGR